MKEYVENENHTYVVDIHLNSSESNFKETITKNIHILSLHNSNITLQCNIAKKFNFFLD